MPTQNYDEFDIKAAAKVLSGWKVKLPTGITSGNPFAQAYPFTVDMVTSYHNSTNKVFSGNFGTTTITGSSVYANAVAEFTTFFNMLFTQQATTIAKYICRRLYRFFVYYDIDATIETNVIAPLATTLTTATSTTAAWDILPVLKQLFKSEHFYDMANRGVMIKAPFDMITGALRNFSISTTTVNTATGSNPNNQIYNQYTVWKYLNDYCNNYLEQSAGLVPNVSGYKAYYQTPGYYQNWINTNTIQRRTSFLNSLLSTNGISTGGISLKVDAMAFTSQFANATIADPDLLVAAMVKILLSLDPGQTVRDNIKNPALLGNTGTNSYWTTAWTNYSTTATTSSLYAGYLATVKSRLSALITAIVQLAEYQLM